MDAYDEGSDARRAQPGGSDDPVSPLSEGGTRAVPDESLPEEPPGPREAGGPEEAVGPEEAAGPEEAIEPEEAAGPEEAAAARSRKPDEDQGPQGTSGPVGPTPRTGIAALSLGYQIAAALALAVVAVTACVHLGMVFLHVGPGNTVTKKHGKAIDEWIYPEFEQNWKLFAPNPLQQNIDVQVRAEVDTGKGDERTTGWYDLSALDGAAIDGNLLPSHTQQNELRRAWDFYFATHDGENRPAGLRGALSESYLRRVVAMRLGSEHAAGRGERVERVQVRCRTSNVPPPKWSDEKISTTPAYRLLPWWDLADGERTEASA